MRLIENADKFTELSDCKVESAIETKLGFFLVSKFEEVMFNLM